MCFAVVRLWCMGTLALTSSIRSPQVAAADEEKGGEEETAGAEGTCIHANNTFVPWPMLARRVVSRVPEHAERK